MRERASHLRREGLVPRSPDVFRLYPSFSRGECTVSVVVAIQQPKPDGAALQVRSNGINSIFTSCQPAEVGFPLKPQ